MREAPTEQPSLDKVAQLAKVSRSTIYADFGSRAGLFDAFVVDLWERTGLGALNRAVAADDARAHLREGIAAASRMKGQELDVYRVLHAMDRLDPESAGGAVRHMETDRGAGWRTSHGTWPRPECCARTSPWSRRSTPCGC